MKAYDVTKEDACEMLGPIASIRVASALVEVIQSMANTYPNTDDIPIEAWNEMVHAAEERA